MNTDLHDMLVRFNLGLQSKVVNSTLKVLCHRKPQPFSQGTAVSRQVFNILTDLDMTPSRSAQASPRLVSLVNEEAQNSTWSFLKVHYFLRTKCYTPY